MISSYPAYKENLVFPDEESATDRVIDAIRAVRNRRSEMNVPPSKKANLYIVTKYPETFRAAESFFAKLASTSELHLVDRYDAENAVSIVTDAATLYIPLGDLVDLEKERERLTNELARVDGEITRLEAKLANEGFVSRAPAAIVDGERQKLAKYRETKTQLEEALKKMR